MSPVTTDTVEIITLRESRILRWATCHNEPDLKKMIAYFMGYNSPDEFILYDPHTKLVENLAHAAERYGITVNNRKAFL